MIAVGRVLRGKRVLDLTNVLAGPFCTYQLAALGAEVVKVERTGTGDLARSLGASAELNEQLLGTSFLAQNSGKRSISIDLKNERGKEVFRALVATSDVVVENFRPGVMDRLGLGFESLSKLRPGLIQCSITGFGQTGPLSTHPAYDQIVQGYSGIMSVTGSQESAPLRVGVPICDTIGGLTAALAVSAAMVSQSDQSEPIHIDIGMLDATVPMMAWAVSNYLIADKLPVPMGNQNFTSAPSGTFYAADAPINVAANEQRQYLALCDVIGRPDLSSDPRFLSREERKERRAELNEILNAEFAKRPAAYWVEHLAEAGIPTGEILSIPRTLEHIEASGRSLLQEFVEMPVLGQALRVVSSGIVMDGTRLGPESPPPELGSDTIDLLVELGLSSAEIGELQELGAIQG